MKPQLIITPSKNTTQATKIVALIHGIVIASIILFSGEQLNNLGYTGKENTHYITSFTIDKQFRGQGIGTYMMGQLLDYYNQNYKGDKLEINWTGIDNRLLTICYQFDFDVKTISKIPQRCVITKNL